MVTFKNLIAPCGMNCGICKAHLREKSEKNYCEGCNNNPVYLYCKKCKMRNCKIRQGDFCNCKDIPCERLKNLDKRYRTKYGMSMIENLEYIHKKGLKNFLKKEKKKWVSKKGILCVHDRQYYKTRRKTI